MRLTIKTKPDDLKSTADENDALLELMAFLAPRLAEADKGAVSALTVTEIFEDECRKAR